MKRKRTRYTTWRLVGGLAQETATALQLKGTKKEFKKESEGVPAMDLQSSPAAAPSATNTDISVVNDRGAKLPAVATDGPKVP